MIEIAHSTTQEGMEEDYTLVEVILDSSVDIIGIFDKETRFLAFNKAYSQATGLHKEEVLGKKYSEVFPSSQGSIDLLKALQGEHIHISKYFCSHTQQYYEKFFVPLRNKKDEIYGVMTTAHNITKRVEAAEKLQQAYETLERTNDELTSFSYVASHDLQEPLRKIQTFGARILESENANLSEKGKDYFRRMQDAATRMQLLIEDLLSYSRLNTSAKIYESTDINLLLKEVKSDLNDRIHERKAIIESDVLPEINVISFQFRQLFFNLMSNALKFSKADVAPHIIIRSGVKKGHKSIQENMDEKKEYYHISISDNGIGFDQQYAKVIFEVFQRLHGKNQYPGTGIGLAICKKIVDNHQGMISARGILGEGAVFDVYIPKNS